jgi:hypothetical protein
MAGSGRTERFDGAAAVTRSLLGWGVVAGPFYLVVGVILALTRDGFELSSHPLSLLMLGEHGWLQRANIMLTGAMVLAASVGFARALQGSTAARRAGRLLGAYGVILVISGIFPPDPMEGFPPGTTQGDPTATGLIHFGAGAIGFVVLAVAAFVVGGWFAGRDLTRSLFDDVLERGPRHECVDEVTSHRVGSTRERVEPNNSGALVLLQLAHSDRGDGQTTREVAGRHPQRRPDGPHPSAGRARGGVPYAGTRMALSAHSERQLRTRLGARTTTGTRVPVIASMRSRNSASDSSPTSSQPPSRAGRPARSSIDAGSGPTNPARPGERVKRRSPVMWADPTTQAS